MFSLGGYPVATTFPGTALACVNCNEASGDGTNVFGIPHGGDVSTLVKNLIILGGKTTAGTGVPATLKLVDLQCYWPGINMNTLSAQTLTGTPTLRYANGANCRLALAARSTTGATNHNLNLSYTNQAGTSGRTLPGTVACTVSAITPHIVHSGTGANNFGPELPLASGDTGVQNVASVTLSAASGSASTAVLMLYRVIADIDLSIASLKSEKEFANQFPSFPVIPDGACLGFLLGAGAAVAATSNFTGNVDTVWG
jgi:hypothetical protein